MKYIQDIFSFYSTPSLLSELLPSLLDIIGLIIIIFLSLFFIMKSFLLDYKAQWSERFCLGWSIFSIYFFCLNQLFGLNLLILSYSYLAVLSVTIIILLRKKIYLSNMKSIFINNYELLMILPLVIILLSSNIKEWDSFAFWQPAAIYLTENLEFPKSDFWHQKHPYSTVLIYYFSNFLGQNIYENVPAIFNLIILILFYLSLKNYLPNKKIIYIGLLLFIFFNPLLINSKTFTNYADNSLAFVLFVIINYIYRNNFFIRNEKIYIKTIEIFYLFIFVSLLTGIKSSGFIFFIIFFLSYSIIFIKPLINYIKNDLRLNNLIIILSLFIPYLVWRVYLANYFNGLNFFNHGFRIEILPDIMSSILNQIMERKILFFNIFLLFIAYYFIKNLKIKYLLKVILLIIFFYNIFLIVSYIVHFSYGEAKSATSYWRYNTQLSYIIFFCDVILLNLIISKKTNYYKTFNSFNYLLQIMLIIILISSPFLLIKKIRYDLFQPYISLVNNRDKINKQIIIDKNSKIFLVSNNPQINKKIYSYYLGIQANYRERVDHIKSINFKIFENEPKLLNNFDFLIEFFDNKKIHDCYKNNNCILIKIKNLKTSEEYKFNFF